MCRRGQGAAAIPELLFTQSAPLTSRACTPRGTGELHSWREEAEELGRAPGLRVQELLPFIESEAADKERETEKPERSVPEPCFPPAAAPHLSFQVTGSEVQAGQVLRRKV